MTRFLAKMVLTIEPTDSYQQAHTAVRAITSHHNSNLIQVLGIDPVVFKTTTTQGEIDLQIWITALSRINRLILPNYFIGARKYLFMCEGNTDSISFVREIIDLAADKLNAAYEFVILLRPIKEKKELAEIERTFSQLFTELNIENYSIRQWQEPKGLRNLFETMAEEIVQQEPYGEFVPVGFDLKTTEAIVRKIGFEINENHEVIEFINDIRFRVNLKKNTIVTELEAEGCIVRKNLCIVVADRGYSSIAGLGDLRLISVLLAIRDKSILQLKGSRRQEDVKYQLEELQKKFKEKCKKKRQKKEKE